MADRRVWSHNETLDFINTATKFKLVEESDSKKIEMKLCFGMYAETWRNGDIISQCEYSTVLRYRYPIIIWWFFRQLRRKWKALKQQYFKAMGSLNTSGHSSKAMTWPYFHPMNEILGGRPRSSVSFKIWNTDNVDYGTSCKFYMHFSRQFLDLV